MPKRKVDRRLTDEQRDLAARCCWVADRLAREWSRKLPCLSEEIRDRAIMALIELAPKYDAGLGDEVQFFRYRIRFALMEMLRLRANKRHVDVKCCGDFAYYVPDPRRRLAEVDSLDAVERLLRMLPTRHAEALAQYYVHGRSNSECSRSMGITSGRSEMLRSEAYAMLRDKLSR